MRVPVSEANDLNYLLCRCDEAGDTNRLGDSEIWPLKQIGLNSVTKNRTLIYQNLTNLIEQRTTANAGMVIGFIWNKEEQGAGVDMQPGRLTPQKKAAPLLISKLDLNRPPRCYWQRIDSVDSPSQNDRALRPVGFNIACYQNRSCHYNLYCLNTAQHFSYGARVLFARPSERSERLKLFVVPLP
jgi:hypothetical protein